MKLITESQDLTLTEHNLSSLSLVRIASIASLRKQPKHGTPNDAEQGAWLPRQATKIQQRSSYKTCQHTSLNEWCHPTTIKRVIHTNNLDGWTISATHKIYSCGCVTGCLGDTTRHSPVLTLAGIKWCRNKETSSCSHPTSAIHYRATQYQWFWIITG